MPLHSTEEEQKSRVSQKPCQINSKNMDVGCKATIKV